MFAEHTDGEKELYIRTICTLDQFENELDHIDLERELLDLPSYSSESDWKLQRQSQKDSHSKRKYKSLL